jgi:hypothetical protein
MVMGAPNPESKRDKPKERRIKVAKNSKKPKSVQKAETAQAMIHRQQAKWQFKN